MNVEIDDRTVNNRLILLLEDKYHADVLAACLQNNIEDVTKSMHLN